MEFTYETISRITKEIAIKIIDLTEEEFPNDDEMRDRLIDAVLVMLLDTYLDTRCPNNETKQSFMNQIMEYVLSVKEVVQ